MTDTYVEKLIITKFLELEDLQSVPKCYQYFNDNKEAEDTLPGFEAFKPEYPEGATDEEKAKIDGPLFMSMVVWFRDTYPEFYKTEKGDPDDDDLYDAIKSVKLELTTIKRIVKIYDETGEEIDYSLFPNVAFPNMDFTRPVDAKGNNTFWYELYFIPAPPTQIELGTTARSRWCGIMQVNVCIPKTWGTEELYARYDEIASKFRSGLILEGARITRTYRSAALDDKDSYCLPVTIEWQADLDR